MYNGYYYGSVVAGTIIMYLVVGLIFLIIHLVALWKIFEKAGENGWAALIPFYNTYMLYKITWNNGWVFLTGLIPIVNIVIGVMTIFRLAKAFGKGVGFGFGLLFLNFIFTLILAFGDAEYEGI